MEGGKSTELGSYALNADPSSDEYASIQFYTERSREEWWVWCLRSAANQIAVYQGPIEEGWRLYNGSRTRLKRLYSEVELIDTIIFTKTDTYLDEAECNRIIECETLADLEAATASIKDCRVAVITFEKDGDGVASAR